MPVIGLRVQRLTVSATRHIGQTTAMQFGNVLDRTRGRNRRAGWSGRGYYWPIGKPRRAEPSPDTIVVNGLTEQAPDVL
jgi:hypothetical protein